MAIQTRLFETSDMSGPLRAGKTPRSRRKGQTIQAAATLPLELDTIHKMDCVEGMRLLPDHSVDLAVVDPPYNASKGGHFSWNNSVDLPGFGGNWSKVMEAWDSMGLGDYIAFTMAWLAEVRRVVKPTGSVWVHGTYHNIGIVNFLMQSSGIEIINEVVWYKRNSFPNLAGRRLTASHETILWAHTGKTREYLFNYAESKSMACPEDSLKALGKQMRTVWDIPNNKGRDELQHGKHPTQKPIRLLCRMMELSSKPGGVCLVPFSGAGSECVAAVRSGLRFLAFEIDPQYVAIARKRLTAEHASSIVASTRANPHATGALQGKRPAIAESDAGDESRRIPSLIKWTGSKRSQASAIRGLLPEYERYFEPFLGGGAMLYVAGGRGSVAGDLYAPLIALWKAVQRRPDDVIADYERQWGLLQADLPEYFYEVRKRFNTNPNPLDLSFLMRTCVNGIVRFNDRGEFNNSFHLSRNGMEPRRFARSVRAWSARVRGVRFVCQDYDATVADAARGDFVYLDPPYAGNRQRYVQNLDLGRFWTVLESLNRRGVKWALSFDGRRGDVDLSHPVPDGLYRRRALLASGNSAVGKVLNGPVEQVDESLYMNY